MKVTYDTLPAVVTILLDKVERIEKIILLLINKSEETAIKRKKRNQKKVGLNQIPEGMISIIEAEKLFDLSRTKLHSYIKSKKIPFTKVGRRILFSKLDLENWINMENEPKKTMPEEIPAEPGNEKSIENADIITIREAVLLLKMKPSKIHYLLKRNKVPVVSKKGNKLYYSKKELIDVITEN